MSGRQWRGATAPCRCERRTSSRPTGDIIAPPMPCRIRASVNSVMFWLSPHSTEAMVNTAMATLKTARAPKRSVSQALAGMKIATVSR